MQHHYSELEDLDRLATWLDDRFRIPGTQIRFGLDALLGLVPYVGDVFTLLLSGYLVGIMWRRGASGMLILRMLGNLLLDAIIGAIPVIGDIIDVGYRANRKNVVLMQEHYESGDHRSSGIGVLLLIMVFLQGMLFLFMWIAWRILSWLFS